MVEHQILIFHFHLAVILSLFFLVPFEVLHLHHMRLNRLEEGRETKYLMQNSWKSAFAFLVPVVVSLSKQKHTPSLCSPPLCIKLLFLFIPCCSVLIYKYCFSCYYWCCSQLFLILPGIYKLWIHFFLLFFLCYSFFLSVFLSFFLSFLFVYFSLPIYTCGSLRWGYEGCRAKKSFM